MFRSAAIVGIFLFSFFLFMACPLRANNVRISGEPVVRLNAASDSLSLSFTLSWDNSWRDDFNWDAVWLFVKYRKEGSKDAWSHLVLGRTQTGTSNLYVDCGNTGSSIVGVFAYPKNKGSFNISGEKLTLKAPLNGLSASDITANKVYFAVNAVEMVLVPYGSYYLGDDVSNKTFTSVQKTLYGPIPESSDVVDNNSGYVITASHEEQPAVNAADHQNNSVYPTGSWYTNTSEVCWWKIDFLSTKTIRYFGVSGATNYPLYAPDGVWYIEGSNDNATWTTLSAVDAGAWRATTTSYPVQQSIKVKNPGAYRYYRLYFPKSHYPMVQNIAMTEDNLFGDNMETGCLVDNEDGCLLLSERTEYSVSAAYPKGYKGFYCMKYEVSQEQYVQFLNMLNYMQQKNRIGNNLDNLKKGDYAFGDPKTPNCRNGIAVFSTKGSAQPAVFGNNLNPAEPFFAPDDGQTLACNYLTAGDMLSYLDWSGLRPMSELEYEKACRVPDRSVGGEYAWNTIMANKLPGLSGLFGAGSENEQPFDIDVNVNSGNAGFGPVRCGGFGSGSSSQSQSGATYYGLMEMSGNVGELCYSISGGSGFNVSDVNNNYYGDGSIGSDGNSNVSVSYWPSAATANAFIVRGGSFAGGDTLLRISDRSVIVSNNTLRDSTCGFRGVRSVGINIFPGSIIVKKTDGTANTAACPGIRSHIETNISASVDMADISFKYLWYVQIPGSAVWQLIPDQNDEALDYDKFVNTGTANVTYKFKRKAICPVGEGTSADLTLTVPNPSFTLLPNHVNLDGANASSSLVTSEAKQTSSGAFTWHLAEDRPPIADDANITYATGKSVYRADRKHYGDPFMANGEYSVICRYTIGGCSVDSILKVDVSPYNSNPCGGLTSVTDASGKSYDVVKIGAQCWMRQNIDIGDFAAINSDYWIHKKPGIQKWCSEDNTVNCDKYGGLYEWWEVICNGDCGGQVSNPDMTITQGRYASMEEALKAAVSAVRMTPDGKRIRGICPAGWHLPTNEELKQLEMFLGMSRNSADKVYPNSDGDGWGRGNGIGALMKAEAPVWNGTSTPNAAGEKDRFYGLPHGYRVAGGAGFVRLDGATVFWSSTIGGTGTYDRNLTSMYNSVFGGPEARSYGYSVRCVKD